MLLQLSYNKNEMVYNRSSLLKILENLKKISKEFFQKKIILIFSFLFIIFIFLFPSLLPYLLHPLFTAMPTPSRLLPFLFFCFISFLFLFFSFFLFLSFYFPFLTPPPPSSYLLHPLLGATAASLFLCFFLLPSHFFPCHRLPWQRSFTLLSSVLPLPLKSYKTHVIFGSLCVFSNHRSATAVQLIFSGILRFKPIH